jgi:hypothetical protein
VAVVAVVVPQGNIDGWDVRLSATHKESGTYVQVANDIDFSGNAVVRKGTVTLIR